MAEYAWYTSMQSYSNECYGIVFIAALSCILGRWFGYFLLFRECIEGSVGGNSYNYTHRDCWTPLNRISSLVVKIGVDVHWWSYLKGQLYTQQRAISGQTLTVHKSSSAPLSTNFKARKPPTEASLMRLIWGGRHESDVRHWATLNSSWSTHRFLDLKSNTKAPTTVLVSVYLMIIHGNIERIWLLYLPGDNALRLDYLWLAVMILLHWHFLALILLLRSVGGQNLSFTVPSAKSLKSTYLT